MADCVCANFPSGLGPVTIGDSLVVGTGAGAPLRLDVRGNARVQGASQFPLVLDAPTSHPEVAVVQFGNSSGAARWYLGHEGDFVLYDHSGSPGFRLRVQAGSGNVGIGTTTPAQKLDVQGGSTRLKSTSQFPLVLEAGSAGIPFSSVIEFRKQDATPSWWLGAGVVGGNQQEFGLRDLIAGAWRLYVGPTGNVGIGTESPTGPLEVKGILGATNGVRFIHTNGTQGVDIGFSGLQKVASGIGSKDLTVDGYQTGHVLLQTTATGNVGIGTAMPQAKLHVVGGDTRLRSAGQFPLTLEGGNAQIPHSAVIQFRRSDGAASWQLGAGALTGTQHEFGLRDDVAGVFRLYVSSSGQVGIGRNNPEARLHVQGEVRAEGSIAAVNGSLSTTGGFDITSSGKYYAASGPNQSRLIADGSGCYYA